LHEWRFPKVHPREGIKFGFADLEDVLVIPTPQTFNQLKPGFEENN
jgi:hypothetical protein